MNEISVSLKQRCHHIDASITERSVEVGDWNNKDIVRIVAHATFGPGSRFPVREEVDGVRKHISEVEEHLWDRIIHESRDTLILSHEGLDEHVHFFDRHGPKLSIDAELIPTLQE